MTFNNDQSIVVITKKEISPEGVDCIFSSYGEILHMLIESKNGYYYIWICFISHQCASRSVELDGATIAGGKIRIEPANFFIREVNEKKQKKERQKKVEYSSSDYNYYSDESSYSNRTDEEPSNVKKPVPINELRREKSKKKRDYSDYSDSSYEEKRKRKRRHHRPHRHRHHKHHRRRH